MKKIAIVLLLVVWSVATLANPVSPNLFSELLFTDNGWQIEIASFSDWLALWDSTAIFSIEIQSGTDTARFLYNNPENESFLVLTQEDLDSTLNLEPSADSIIVSAYVNDEPFLSDIFSWGPNGNIKAPIFGQSICFGRYHHIDVPFPTYYLDNSPTIGLENDTIGANGQGIGLVIDPYGVPVANVAIHTRFYGSETGWPFFEVLTDSTGRFDFSTISFRWTIYIEKDGYKTQTFTQQIWPDSTIELNIVLQPKPEYYQSYFPLQIGNIWKYYHTYQGDSTSMTITGVTTIEDKQYYILGGSYVRYDSLGNLLLNRNGKDSVFYPLALNGQDSIAIYDSLKFIYASKSLGSIITPAGHFFDLLILEYRHPQVADGNTYHLFARGIGKVEEIFDNPIQDRRWILYYAKVNGVEYPTSGIQPEPTMAKAYALKLANYPNPFNSSTTLKYHLTETGDVRLSVFDLSGRLVAELFSGHQSAGDYHYLWSGGNLPSGVYFLSLQARNHKIIQKCLLMK